MRSINNSASSLFFHIIYDCFLSASQMPSVNRVYQFINSCRRPDSKVSIPIPSVQQNRSYFAPHTRMHYRLDRKKILSSIVHITVSVHLMRDISLRLRTLQLFPSMFFCDSSYPYGYYYSNYCDHNCVEKHCPYAALVSKD
jgi:hypothetical protein